MSKFTRFQKIMLGCIICSLTFAILTKGKTGLLTSMSYDPFVMLKYSVIDYPIETMRNWFSDFNELWNVKEENDQLRYELAMQKQNSALIEELKRENNELKELMQFGQTNDYEKIYAKIVNHNPEIWNNQITINVGENDHIKEDMAVVSSKGLIGKVIEVNAFTSKVRLLTSQDQLSKVAVKVAIDENKAISGYLEQYDLQKNSFMVRMFSDANEIDIGMQVLTSGVGGVFPNGILVGEVNEIVELRNEKGKIVYLTPAADFSAFEYVAVINQKGDSK